MPHRVVQWTTGNVGRRALRAIAAESPAPADWLASCANADQAAAPKRGGFAGIEKLGVAATNDVDALLELRPDCVSYTPMWPNVDELVRILEAGINVVATAAFVTGHGLGEPARRSPSSRPASAEAARCSARA